MSDPIHRLGIVGLGKMGADPAKNALAKGFAVAGTDTRTVTGDLTKAGLQAAKDLEQLAELLTPPRFIMLYVPAGPPVDNVLGQLEDLLQPGDIVADGGNSYWGDSIRRHARLKQKSIRFIDAGTSGGPEGALDGACFMLGGEDAAVAAVEPMMRKLAVEDGFVHAGRPGAGHFVKLVHNGIEFAMLEAIGEGVDLLENYREQLPIADVLNCWRHGSAIRSWLVDDALHMEVAIPVITQSVVQLVASRDGKHDAARAIAMMRHGFGGDPYGRNAGIAHERHTGRVGGFIGNGQAAP